MILQGYLRQKLRIFSILIKNGIFDNVAELNYNIIFMLFNLLLTDP